LLQDEATLLQRVQQFDTEALAQVYDHYYDRIYRYVYGYLGQADAAEDLTANVFFRLLNAVQGDKSPRKNLSAWLYRVAHNLVVDKFRRMPPEELELAEWLESDQPGPAQTVEQTIQLERVRVALRYLTEAQQQVILLKFMMGMDSREIATVLGRSSGAVDALQHRALRSLRKTLGDTGPGPTDAAAGGAGNDPQPDGERGNSTSMISRAMLRHLVLLLAPCRTTALAGRPARRG
jgi:RNA polymerase sigma-70 factor (ECF subfamily)